MGKNAGYLLNIEGGGKAIAYHREQEKQFKALKKLFIHYMSDDLHPIIENGKEKTGLKSADKLTICGYLD